MTEQERLLGEARDFCDATTGEVLQRIPEELMAKLRAAKLARGVPGMQNARTETYATWFVFLTDDIREQVLEKWREANRQRRRRHSATGKAKGQPIAAGVGSRPSKPGEHGLQQFRLQRKSAK